MSNQRLGRGLDELLPNQEETNQGSLNHLTIEEISPNPHQPRQSFDDEKIQELAQSIKQQGVVEPIVVRPSPDGDRRYMIIAGERRWRAAQKANLKEIPGIVRDLDPQHAYLISLVENVQRENLSPIEEAEAYQKLMDKNNYGQQEVANAVGKSRSSVANRLRLLKLPDSVKAALNDELISAGHARALQPLPEDQVDGLLDEIISKELNVRETEKRVQELQTANEKKGTSEQQTDPSNKSEPKNDFNRLEGEFEENLGANVDIKSENRKSGTIIIHFSSPDEFESLRKKIDKIS